MREIIGFPIDRHLAERLHDTVHRLRTADDEDLPRREAAELVIQIMSVGLDFHFRRPMRAMKTPPALRRAVDLAVIASERAAGTALRRITRNLPAAQMRGVADYLEEALHRLPHGS